MTAKSVMTLHEALDKIGIALHPKEWNVGDWQGYLTPVDTSDLADGTRPSKPKIKKQNVRARDVIGQFVRYVRAGVITPFVVKGKLKKEIPVAAFESIGFMKEVLPRGRISIHYSKLHILTDGALYVSRREVENLFKPKDEQFMSPQEKWAGTGPRYDYAKIAAVVAAIEVIEGTYNKPEPLATRVVEVWQYLWPDDPAPENKTIIRSVVGAYKKCFSEAQKVLKNDIQHTGKKRKSILAT